MNIFSVSYKIMFTYYNNIYILYHIYVYILSINEYCSFIGEIILIIFIFLILSRYIILSFFIYNLFIITIFMSFIHYINKWIF